MATYKIQHQIRTLVENAVGVAQGYPSFTAESIIFSHWEFNHRDGWVSDAWLAELEIETDTAPKAMTEFDVGPVGSMFQEEDKKALDLLLANTTIPEEFFLYWNDAVNATGYSSKLLIMLSALEALTRDANGKKDIALQKTILGDELEKDLYAQHTGLRGRLVHGEYFSDQDTKDYMVLIHKAVIKYFNDHVLNEKLIEENITGPQRHYLNNDNLLRAWIQQKEAD